MLEWRKNILMMVSGAMFLLVTACAPGPEIDGRLPSDPNPEDQPETNLPDSGVVTDGRLPSWVQSSAPFQLVDSVNYSGLEDLFGIIYTDSNGKIVGNPLIHMEITGTRSQDTAGKLNFGFEDAAGFAYLGISSVAGASSRTSTDLDMIFSDDEGAMRVVGQIANAKLSGSLYYRIRGASEDQCRRFKVCDYSTGSWSCRETVDVPACKNYMDITATQVKKLGNFQTDYLKWVK